MLNNIYKTCIDEGLKMIDKYTEIYAYLSQVFEYDVNILFSDNF